jgi:hypothetical protein
MINDSTPKSYNIHVYKNIPNRYLVYKPNWWQRFFLGHKPKYEVRFHHEAYIHTDDLKNGDVVTAVKIPIKWTVMFHDNRWRLRSINSTLEKYNGRFDKAFLMGSLAP